MRTTTIATIGAGLIAICHVNSELGTYIVWLIVGAGPMLSLARAGKFLVAEAFALAASVVMARALAETPWLMLPFIFAVISGTAYAGTALKLGASFLLIQVVCLDTFYAVVFAPGEIGWGASGAFAGSVIAFGMVVLFDNWLWPEPGEAALMEALGASVARARSRLLAASRYYLDGEKTARPPLPPATSDLPGHMALLNQAVAEGVSEHRHAILLAAVTRVARIGLEVDRLTISARENLLQAIPTILRSEVQSAIDAIAAALDEIAREMPTHIAVGVDKPPPVFRVRARSAMDLVSIRIIQVRPAYISAASSAEIENFASFTDSLAALTGHIERLLDEPPQPTDGITAKAAQRKNSDVDPAIVRFALKVGVCTVAGYLIGILSQRPEMSTILTTVLITALPTYGAARRKMILRIVGGVIGGAVSLITIIIVSPNFVTLPAYLLTLFVVLYVSAYSSLGSGRIAYAGKQIGTTLALVFAGLSPSIDIYGPLWRTWGILLGTAVVAVVAFIIWPEYAGDSLLPRLRRVIRDTLALLPGSFAANSEQQIHRVNSETMRLLAEILEVADDAQVEGRSSMIDHRAVVEAAGTLRRIANRLASIATGRIAFPLPALDPTTESAREAVFVAIRSRLESWLDFFSGDESLSATAARKLALSFPPDQVSKPLTQFGSRLEEREFARIEVWKLEQRREILAELQSMRRLEFLISELNRWLPQIPGSAAS
ncbi:MAG: FUSC family protein [Deltaproteobacteria bacterium]|nr:FUSC family protein [Deltaproteobacteria bacterium]